MLTGGISRVYAQYFARKQNLELQFLPYSSRFFYLALDNKFKAYKAMKSDTLLS